MPNFVKSGKYFYKVNQKTGDKTRISKDEYKKHVSKSRKRLVTKRPSKKINKKVQRKVERNINRNVMRTVNRKVIKHNVSNNSVFDVDGLIREKLRKVNRQIFLNSIISVDFDVKKGGKLYNIKARVGKCPRSGYYVYRVNAQHVSDNGMVYSLYNRSLMSSNIDILRPVSVKI